MAKCVTYVPKQGAVALDAETIQALCDCLEALGDKLEAVIKAEGDETQAALSDLLDKLNEGIDVNATLVGVSDDASSQLQALIEAALQAVTVNVNLENVDEIVDGVKTALQWAADNLEFTVLAKQEGQWVVDLTPATVDALQSAFETALGNATVTVEGIVGLDQASIDALTGPVELGPNTLAALENITVTIDGPVALDQATLDALENITVTIDGQPIDVNVVGSVPLELEAASIQTLADAIGAANAASLNGLNVNATVTGTVDANITGIDQSVIDDLITALEDATFNVNVVGGNLNVELDSIGSSALDQLSDLLTDALSNNTVTVTGTVDANIANIGDLVSALEAADLKVTINGAVTIDPQSIADIATAIAGQTLTVSIDNNPLVISGTVDLGDVSALTDWFAANNLNVDFTDVLAKLDELKIEEVVNYVPHVSGFIKCPLDSNLWVDNATVAGDLTQATNIIINGVTYATWSDVLAAYPCITTTPIYGTGSVSESLTYIDGTTLTPPVVENTATNVVTMSSTGGNYSNETISGLECIKWNLNSASYKNTEFSFQTPVTDFSTTVYDIDGPETVAFEAYDASGALLPWDSSWFSYVGSNVLVVNTNEVIPMSTVSPGSATVNVENTIGIDIPATISKLVIKGKESGAGGARNFIWENPTWSAVSGGTGQGPIVETEIDIACTDKLDTLEYTVNGQMQLYSLTPEQAGEGAANYIPAKQFVIAQTDGTLVEEYREIGNINNVLTLDPSCTFVTNYPDGPVEIPESESIDYEALATAVVDKERDVTPEIYGWVNNNAVQSLPYPPGTMGRIKSFKDAGSGVAMLTIDGSSPTIAGGASSTMLTSGPYHDQVIENVDLSLVRMRGSSTGSDYSIVVEVYN